MRIISGRYGSRRLDTLKGANTRPSSDKLKAALFSKIGPYFDGGTVLDVFAGSGAVGLEALSRGMDTVVFIESSRQACAVIKQNIETLGVQQESRIIAKDALKASREIQETFDFIFMDPPYAYEKTIEIAQNLAKCVKIDGVLVVETNNKTEMPDMLGKLKFIEARDYGLARLHYYEML